MLEILEILTIPKTVATVHRPADLDFLAENDISGVCDLLEFRLDSLRDHLDRAENAIAAAEAPCIVTARHPEEGGDGDLDSTQRRTLYERFLPHASLIDVEIRSLDEMRSIAAAARENGVAVIASHHDFEKSPPPGELTEVIDEAFAAGADVAKIAVTLGSMASLFELAQFMELAPDPDSGAARRRLSLMGMGPLGKLSRLVFASAGSCLNYGYLVEPNAPGQWPAGELKRLIAELKPASG